MSVALGDGGQVRRLTAWPSLHALRRASKSPVCSTEPGTRASIGDLQMNSRRLGKLLEEQGVMPSGREPAGLARLVRADTPPRRLRVFISSVFCEPYGRRWDLREKLYDILRQAMHEPWLFEKEGEELKKQGISATRAILHGIEGSDAVLAVYRTRAGSVMRREPFYGTDFEVLNAIRLNKPVHLYVIGERHDRKLKNVLGILGDNIILPSGAIRVSSEGEVLDRVLADLHSPSYAGRETETTRVLYDPVLNCEELYRQIAGLTSSEDYRGAVGYAEDVGVFNDPYINPDKCGDKHAYARLLGLCANVWANRACFTKAVKAAKRSVRLFMELGDWHQMYAQIQAASGILNMQGHGSAEWWNAFGRNQALRKFHELVPAFNDSRGSIMIRKGDLRSAKNLLQSAYEATGSAYNLSKYAAVSAALGGHRDVDEAQRWLEQARSIARGSGVSVGYVARHAAALAIRTGDFELSKRYLAEGIEYCEQKGLVHTMLMLRREQAKLSLLTV